MTNYYPGAGPDWILDLVLLVGLVVMSPVILAWLALTRLRSGIQGRRDRPGSAEKAAASSTQT